MKSGDQSALAEIYDRYASVVYAVALRVLGDTGAAAACRLELEQLRGDGALLALSTAGPRPPVRARQRLLDTVAKEADPLRLFRKKRERMGQPV
jgi:hypothetical protein